MLLLKVIVVVFCVNEDMLNGKWMIFNFLINFFCLIVYLMWKEVNLYVLENVLSIRIFLCFFKSGNVFGKFFVVMYL